LAEGERDEANGHDASLPEPDGSCRTCSSRRR
jgi:hypothetical protein